MGQGSRNFNNWSKGLAAFVESRLPAEHSLGVEAIKKAARRAGFEVVEAMEVGVRQGDLAVVDWAEDPTPPPAATWWQRLFGNEPIAPPRKAEHVLTFNPLTGLTVTWFPMIQYTGVSFIPQLLEGAGSKAFQSFCDQLLLAADVPSHWEPFPNGDLTVKLPDCPWSYVAPVDPGADMIELDRIVLLSELGEQLTPFVEKLQRLTRQTQFWVWWDNSSGYWEGWGPPILAESAAEARRLADPEGRWGTMMVVTASWQDNPNNPGCAILA